MDWANKSAKEQVAELLGLIAQLEQAAIKHHDRYSRALDRVDQLKAENQGLRAEIEELKKQLSPPR
jgi:hypothetical protein